MSSHEQPRSVARCRRLSRRAAALSVVAASALFSAAPAARATPYVAPGCGATPSLVNGSFETGEFPHAYGIWYFNGANDPSPVPGIGWSTTATDHQLEFWASKSNPSPFRANNEGTPADTGDQFAELNGTQRATLFQDRPTDPGSTIRWRLAHRGRDGDETMHVLIGAPADPGDAQTPDGTSSVDLTDGIDAWGHYTGTYHVPSGQTTTRFAFASVTPATGGQGNFLDSITFDVSATACTDSATTVADQPVFVDAVANDRGDKPVLGQPGTAAHGTVALVGGQYRYTPANGYTGSDTFIYPLTDSFGTAVEGTVHIQVNPASAGPLPTPALTSSAAETVVQNGAVTIPPYSSVRLLDADGIPRTTVTIAGRGTYSVDTGSGQITFTPDASFIGTAPVRYELTDDNGQRSSGTYTPTVTPTPRTGSVLGDTVLAGSLNHASGGTTRFVAPGGALVSELVVPNVGRYRVDDSGAATFEPAAGYSGTTAAQAFRFTDATGQSTDNTWTIDVTAPTEGDFYLQDKHSQSSDHQVQTAGGYYADFSQYTVKFDFGAGNDAPFTVPGVGTYSIEPGSARLQFTPVPGYFGERTITYRVVSSYGFAVSASYRIAVYSGDASEGGNPPPGVGTDVESTGVGTATQSAAIVVPAGGSAQLVDSDQDGAAAYPTWTVPGQGTYTIDAATGTVSFKAVLGYVGSPAPFHYQVVDADNIRTVGLYSPHVTKPAAPTARPAATTGTPVDTQTTTVDVPADGTVTLIDADGAETDTVTIAGEGTYVLNRATGVVTFSAQSGFTGRSRGVTYRVTDAYGQNATAIYAAEVLAPKAADPAPAATPAPPALASPTVTPAPASPAAAVCVSKRKFAVHWRVTNRVKLRSITFALSGAKPRKLSGKARQATVDLRGRRTSTVTLLLTATTTSGKTLTATRDYHPCSPTEAGNVKTLHLAG